jgi:hypothetical protein
MENPFEPSFGNRPERIVGRDVELDGIEQGLRSRRGSRDRATFISGQRGMGKTALLLEIEGRASRLDYVVARAIASETMTSTIIERLQLKGSAFVKDGGRRVAGFSAGALGFSFGLTFSDEVQAHYGFETKLGLICDALEEAGKGVLILVDEVLATSKEMRQLAAAYQNLVGDGKNVAICMAGLPVAISDVLNDKVITSFNRATKVNLGPLETSSVYAYYMQTFEDVGVSIGEALVGRAAEAAQGFPYLMQLIGYYLVQAGAGREVDEAALDGALAYAKRDLANNVYRPTLDALSNKDVEFLEAMAQDDGRSAAVDIQARMNVDNSYFQNYRRRLLDAGVIEAPRRGELEFAVPYLADYLRAGGR